MLLHFPLQRKVAMSANPQRRLSGNLHISDRPSAQSIIVLPRHNAAIAPLPDLIETAKSYVANAKANNTRLAYRRDWNDFEAWCAARQMSALPALPETIALYLTDRAATHKVSTLERRLTSISQVHQAARLDSPTHSIAVRELMKGIRRTHGTAATGKAPTLTDDIKAMVASLPASRHGLQERALLLLGFAGAFRRSELVSLNVEDIQFTRAGLVIHLRRSKTDQEGEGRQIGIPNGASTASCPVRSLKRWMQATGITSGALFRPVDNADRVLDQRLSDKAVARAVKRGAERIGQDPTLYGGHSLRAGLATAAAAAGASERAIMNQTGHKSEKMVRRYIREGNLFRDNAAGAIGL